jgi:hypothetical protein
MILNLIAKSFIMENHAFSREDGGREKIGKLKNAKAWLPTIRYVMTTVDVFK